jgi:hypothetical protein
MDLLRSDGVGLFGMVFRCLFSSRYFPKPLIRTSPKCWLAGALAGSLVAAVDCSGSDTGKWLIQTWETADGLPENSATAMVQTPDGYLWFGTFRGWFDLTEFVSGHTTARTHPNYLATGL